MVRDSEAEAEHGVVLEGGGGYGRATSLGVLLVRPELVVVSPNQAAPNSGRDDQMVTVQSRQHAANDCLGATRAGTWVEEIRLQKLQVLQAAGERVDLRGMSAGLFDGRVPLVLDAVRELLL